MAEQQYTVACVRETIGEEKSSSALSEIAIGIDIGTSQCSVGIWNGNEVELVRDTGNQKLMRSYITFKDDTPAGEVRNQLSPDHEMLSGAAIFNMKRLIGRVDTDPVVHTCKSLPFLVQTLDIGVPPLIAALVDNVWRSTTSEEVLALFLIELRAMVEIQLKQPIRNVVLTIPASFNRFQLSKIEGACATAGLHVLRFMPEPTAVALLYAQQQQETISENMGSESEKNVLIFNMGAGYCDVAVASAEGGVSQIKALAGGPIGGEDMLQNTMRHLFPGMEFLLMNHGLDEIRSMASLRVATQDAIHQLSFYKNVHVDIDLGNGRTIIKDIHREEFEEVNQDVFQKCGDLIEQCLRDSKLHAYELNDVILVGGCSYIPRLQNVVKTVCKKHELYQGMNPLEAAVRGAALEGAVASGINDPLGNLDLLTIQATPLGIGIKVEHKDFEPIIPRNTPMPARKELFFTTPCDKQTEAMIVVYEGDGNVVQDNHLLGYLKIVGIPPALKGMAMISICMDIDASNVLRVIAGVRMPSSDGPVMPLMDVRMPMVDYGHGGVAEGLDPTHGCVLTTYNRMWEWKLDINSLW